MCWTSNKAINFCNINISCANILKQKGAIRIMKPFKHQTKTTDFILSKPGVLITSDPGTGKTRSVIDAFVKRGFGDGRMLVLAPLSILEASWGDDIYVSSHRSCLTQLRTPKTV